jgi:hypothetical protein
MKRNIVSAALVILLVFQPPSEAYVSAAERVRDRNPDSAFWMGFFFPGGGQFYNGQNWEGIKEVAWEGVILIGVVGGMFYISTSSLAGSNSGAVAAGAGLLGLTWLTTLRIASALKASEDVDRINRGLLKP